jgi:hypothetical protein
MADPIVLFVLKFDHLALSDDNLMHLAVYGIIIMEHYSLTWNISCCVRVIKVLKTWLRTLMIPVLQYC